MAASRRAPPNCMKFAPLAPPGPRGNGAGAVPVGARGVAGRAGVVPGRLVAPPPPGTVGRAPTRLRYAQPPSPAKRERESWLAAGYRPAERPKGAAPRPSDQPRAPTRGAKPSRQRRRPASEGIEERWRPAMGRPSARRAPRPDHQTSPERQRVARSQAAGGGARRLRASKILRAEGLEPPWLAPLEPKSSVSTVSPRPHNGARLSRRAPGPTDATASAAGRVPRPHGQPPSSASAQASRMASTSSPYSR